ncbi:MAG TPA: anti-sigma regulatory factor [Candidatus Limnocylindrales bacterium]
MMVCESLTLAVRNSEDIVHARQAVRSKAVQLGFSLIDQTKLVTAASELARNTVDHGRGGTMLLEHLEDGEQRGIRLTFEDQGPGIRDIEQALRDGYSTGSGLGMGLGGARRLVNDFEIRSTPGEGTTIVVARWTWKLPR